MNFTTGTTTKNYLVDGGPAKHVNPKLFWGIAAYLTKHARIQKGEFSLDGIVVTHPDHDHIEGILKLLEEFPPNKDPKEDRAKLIFHGPLLITEYFKGNSEGAELINIVKRYDFIGKKLTDNPSNAGFGSNFEFHFFAADGKYDGLTFNHNQQVPKPHALMLMAALARNTVDDSIANLSSIITVWKDPAAIDPNKDLQVVLTGDCIGYRVLELLKPLTAAQGKSVNVFQVPHHGSARNSLPLKENVLPPPSDTMLMKQVLAFKVLLAYKFDSANWNNIVNQEMGNDGVSDFNAICGKKGIIFDGIMSYIVPATVQALNENKSIDPPSLYQSKAEYCYDQVKIAVAEIEQNIKQYKTSEQPDMESIFKFKNEAFFGTHKKRLYTVTMKTATQFMADEIGTCLALNIAQSCHKELVNHNNRLLDEITASQVAKFYSSFQAKLYYISTVDWKHHHPHQSLLDGLIQGSVAQKNSCTILLASGDVLRLRKLPDPKEWNTYVEFQYLTESGHATIDSADGAVTNAAVYVPDTTDKKSLKRTREELDRGSTAQYFRKRVNKNGKSYKMMTTPSGSDVSYFLFVNSDLKFELQKDEVDVKVTTRVASDGNDILLSITHDTHNARCYIERLNANVDKYRFYDIEKVSDQENFVYRYLYYTNTGELVWEKKSYPNASLLIFDFMPQANSTSNLLMKQSRFLQFFSTFRSPQSVHATTQKQPLGQIVASGENLSLETYLQYWEITDAESVIVKTLLSLLMGPDMSDQFTSLKGLPPDVQSLINVVLQYTMDKTTTIAVTDEGEVSLATLFVTLPEPPPSFLGAPVQKIQLDVENPGSDDLTVKIVLQWSQWQDTINLTPLFDLSKRDISLSNYLEDINYPVGISDCFFSDIILLLLDGFTTGATAYMGLPLSLAANIVNWKIDNIRSRVKVAYILGETLVENATVYAAPKPAGGSLPLGPFQVSFQELAAHYLANSTTMTYTGEVMVSYQSSSKQVSFQIVQNLSSTAEVQFVVSGTSLSEFLSFLKLNSNLADIYVPLVGALLNAVTVAKIGFTLKQDVYDSSNLRLQSIFFEVSQGNLGQYLPSAVRPSGIAVKVSIFQPMESTHIVGVEASFTADVHSSSQDYKLSCMFSILPISTTDGPSSTGYICTCLLSTSGINYSGSASLGSLMAVLGLENTVQAISSSVPVLKSLLDNITLQEVSLTYNSAKVSHVDTFYISLLIPHWNLFSNISIDALEIKLQFSKGSGWSAFMQGDVQFGKDYSISVEFILPTDTTAGSLSFENPYEEFTVNEFITSLGLPALSEVPILGSILDITIKSATLGLKTGVSGGLSLYGFKVEIYIGSADMKIFTLSDVNAALAYNESASGHEVSFSISGFINKKAFVEARYEPNTSEFTGRLMVSTNNTLSVNESVGFFISQEGLSQNSAYTAVSSSTSVDVFLKLKYLSAQKNVLVKQFSINLSSFGPLSKLQLLYQNSLDDTVPDSTAKSPILPVGSSLHLSAVLKQNNGNFGLQLSFDCNVKSPDSKVLTATIQPSSEKSLSLRSFLSLFGLTPPGLPDSGANSKPSTDGFLDLELIKGSLTFATAPFKMKAFEVTTGLSGSRWALLSDPDITLKDIYLSVSYTEDQGVSATLYGSVLVGNVQIRVAGTKTDQVTKFRLVVSQSTDDLIDMVHSVSPVSKQATTIPTDAGLPIQLQGSLAALAVDISPQSVSLSLQLDVNLPKWSIDLGFSQFTATDLHLALSWKKQSQDQENPESASSVTEYLLTLSANLQFGDILAVVELEIGSQSDTILQASINPVKIDLGVITDQTLGFHPKPPPDSQSEKNESSSFSDLLPTDIIPFNFTTGYLQFNLTHKLCLVFGSVKDLGSCLLVAGKLEEKSGIGYAVSFSLSSLSSLLPPLATIGDTITVKDVNVSIINLDGINVENLVNAVQRAQEHVSELPQPPYINLPLKPDDKIGQQGTTSGTSLYSVLDFNEDSTLLSNLVSTQQSKTMPGDIILYAQVNKKDPTSSRFLAYVSSLTLFGPLNFTDIKFQYTPSQKSIVTLTGDISIPALAPDSKFHGSLQAGDKVADFSLTGSNQPKKLEEPLGMFGVSITSPVLQLHYEFNPYNSNYEVSGNVNFYPPAKDTSESVQPSTGPEPPSVTLTAKCFFINGTPKVVDITLLTSTKPLTVADLVATIFNTSWDMAFLNIGFYSGRLYYAKLEKDEKVQDPMDGFEYKSGYHMSCRTSIFTEDFQFNIDMSIPLDKTGFSISGSTLHPLDFGIFKVSTGTTDSIGDFLHKGPSLSYNYQPAQTSLSLEAGITFLDVTVAKTTIQYFQEATQFQFTVTYPKDFLGVRNPSISFTWNKERGFRITSWALPNPSLPGLDDELISEIKNYLAKPTSKGCSAIVGLVFDKAITSKFDIGMSTADKSKWKVDDLFALQLGGTYEINIAGEVEITSVDLPDIVVHLPKVQNLTMDGVISYVLKTLKANVGSMAEQLVQQPDHLAKLLAAIALKKLAKQALIEAVDSLLCRGVDKSEIKALMEEETTVSESELEKGEAEMDNALDKFSDHAVDSVLDTGFAAWAALAADVVGAASVIGTIVGGLLSLFYAIAKIFGGSQDSDKYKKQRDKVNKESEHAKEEIEKVLKLSPPMQITLSEDVLNVSWHPLPTQVPNVKYTLNADIKSVIDPPSHFTHTTKDSSWQMKNDSLYTASKVTVSIAVSCTLTGKNGHMATFTGKSVLTDSLSHTATLPPPNSVTIVVDSKHALAGKVQGISQDSKAVNIELVLVDFSGENHVVSSQQEQVQPGSVADKNYTFLPTDYMQFSGKGFVVQSQSLRESLQSSTFTKSDVIDQAPSLKLVSHTLPLFSGENKTIDIKWSLDSTVELETIICQITDASSGKVMLTKSVDKPLPNNVPFDIADLASKMVTNALLHCQAAFIPSRNDLANSTYRVDSTSFEILSAPTKLSVTYVENKLNDVLSISWLPLSDIDRYQVQFVDKASKVVVVSREFDITHPANKTTGTYLASYKLPAFDMTKLQPSHHYSVQIFSLGNDSNHLFSLTPTTLPEAVHYLEEVKSLSAEYNPDSDNLAITCSQSSGAKSYKFYVLMLSKTQPTSEAVIVATFSFPAPENSGQKEVNPPAPKDLKFSKSVAEFRDKLSTSGRYSLEVKAFGETVDVASQPQRAAQQWDMLESPTNVSYTYDPTYQDDTLTVKCGIVPDVSSYTLAVINMQSQKSVSATVKEAQKPSTVFKGGDIGGKGGDKFQCLAQTTGVPNTFNSKWTSSSTTLERLTSPATLKATYGSDVTQMTLTYTIIPNSQSYYLQLIKAGGKVQDFPAKKPILGDKYLVVILPIEDAADLQPGSNLKVQATAIAKENENFLNSMPKVYVSPTIKRMDSPQTLSSTYKLKTESVSLKWSSVNNGYAYSIQLLQMPSTIVDQINNIKGVEYNYSMFPQVSTSNSYNFAVIAHSVNPYNPVLPSTPTSLQPGKEWIVDDIITKLKIKSSPSLSDHIFLRWDLNSKYELAELGVAVIISQDKDSTQRVLAPPTGASSVDIDVTPEVKYKFKVFSTLSQKYIIGLPHATEFEISKLL